jgi:hypothetical protein
LLYLAGPAAAQPRQLLMPGVTYERQVQFGSHGPVVTHVLVAPRPGGLYSFRPVLATGLVQGRETVTSMEKRVSGAATVAGVNGDLFNWNDGHPTGIVMQDGVLWHRPSADRSSIGIDSEGTLHVDRVTMFGTWQGSGQRRVLLAVNEPPTANAVSVYTPAWGPTTPAQPGSYEVVLSPFAPALPNAELAGAVTAVTQTGSTPIPAGGAVLVARGTQVEKLAAEAPVGGPVTIRLLLQPDWTGILQAVGGGPVIVKDGKVVFRANELFTPDQLLPRNPRTAIGQRADGKIVMLVVDGRQPGYSVGLTNFELGLAMQRLGCVTASALDSGGSSTMAFDGQLLNQPSDETGERAVKEALLVYYTGVYAPAASQPVISPNGDGIAERQALSYKLVRPSTVNAQLVGPNGQAYFSDSGLKNPGVYKVTWPAAGAPPLQGRWQWVVTAQDDQGQRSSVDRGFTVNNTLGFLRSTPPALAVPRAKPRTVATVTVAQAATVLAWVESAAGAPIVNVASGRVAAGTLELRWDGRNSGGSAVFPGRYVLKVAANNGFGRVGLETRFTVVKAKPKPVPRKKPHR